MGFSGMLWFDNTQGRSVQERARRAIQWYKKRFGKMPQICLVNENQFIELKDSQIIDGVYLRGYRYCLPNHFMPGFDDPVPTPKNVGEDV